MSLLLNLGATFFSVALAKFCALGAKLAALCRTEIFKNSFLPSTVNEWNKLDPEMKNKKFSDILVDYDAVLLGLWKMFHHSP